jgi:hypothetical protein
MTSSIAATLTFWGAVTRTSNSASSTSVGMYSCRTRPYSGTVAAITRAAIRATAVR